MLSNGFQAVVLCWAGLVGVYLLTASYRQYWVVIEEADETDRSLSCGDSCINPDTNGSFILHEDCTEWADNFNTICNCSEVNCLFYKYGPSAVANYFQLINLFGLFWGIFFMEALGQLILAGAFAGW